MLITEEMAEAMTPPKEAAISPQQRQQVLLSIAEVATRQGSYHLACKKYTQAGDKETAMKVCDASDGTSSPSSEAEECDLSEPGACGQSSHGGS